MLFRDRSSLSFQGKFLDVLQSAAAGVIRHLRKMTSRLLSFDVSRTKPCSLRLLFSTAETSEHG